VPSAGGSEWRAKNSFPGQTGANNYVNSPKAAVNCICNHKKLSRNGCPKRQNAHIHTLPSPYGPAKWLPLPAPQLPLPGSATKLQSSLISFAVASTPPLLPPPPIPQPKLNARFRSLVYAKSLLPLLMLNVVPPLLYPHPVLLRIRALPFPHAVFLFSQSFLSQIFV
jgi:hypothetical protein